MNRYYLPHHVFFCYRGHALVFLDLRQDDYTLVDGDNAQALCSLLRAQPDATSPGSSEALAEFVANGLLTTDVSSGKPIVPTKVDLALDALVDTEALSEVRVTPRHLTDFAASCASAAFKLRFRSIANIVTAVKQRKARFDGVNCVRRYETRELAAIFLRIRSFFPRNYLCLYDSLALVEFLARYRVFPDWVFGITLEPWAAHCWVQDGTFIFNEDVERAAGYTPIMVV